MSTLPDELYALLETTKDADARAIKTSYFKLIRKHPPETDPEAFQKIRAAYEVLSDPERRAAYDASIAWQEKHEPAVHGVLRAAEECLQKEQFEPARQMLLRLLEQKPEVHEARAMLAFAFLRDGKPQEAVAEFRKLTEAEPAEWQHWTHLAWAYGAGKQMPDALEAARRGQSLAPKSGNAAATVGDVLADMERKDEALQVWKEARANVESRVDKLELRLRALKLQLSIDPKRARAEFDELEAELRAAQDLDLLRLGSARVAGLAGRLYARGAMVPAGTLLDWAGKLAPEPSFEAAPPYAAKVEIAKLPAASQEWIRAAQTNGASPLPPKHGKTLWRLLLAIGFIAWPLLMVISGELDQGAVLPAFILLTAAGVAGSFAYDNFQSVRRDGMPGPWTLHPLWLLRTDRRHVFALPLLHLSDISLTGQPNDARVQARLVFVNKAETLGFADRARAEAWARELSGLRQRTLQLLAGGLLQAEPGIGLLPPAAIAASREKQKLDRLRIRALGLQALGIVIAAGVLTLAAAKLGPARAEESRWGQDAQSLGQLRKHLKEFPGSPHEAEAVKRIEDAVALQVRLSEQRAGHQLPVARLLLEADPERGGIDVATTHENANADGLAAALKAADDESGGRLRQALAEAFTREISVVENRSSAAAVLRVRTIVKKADGVFRAQGHPDVPALGLSCSAEFRVGEKIASLGPWTFSPPASLTSSGRTLQATPDAPQREMLAAGYRQCDRAVMEAIAGKGALIEASQAPKLAEAPAHKSPYGALP